MAAIASFSSYPSAISACRGFCLSRSVNRGEALVPLSFYELSVKRKCNSRLRALRPLAFWKSKEEKPSSIALEVIKSEDQLENILANSRLNGSSVIIEWMAQWCRKCIYLRPKLEKLAAEFYPQIHFYCVDVNAVPKGLVERGGVSKMPTIQLWENGEKKAEVIGGHKAWMVLDEIRDMISTNK